MTRWQQLSARERWVLGGGGGLVALLLGWALVWHPLQTERAAWRVRAQAADASLQWMRAAAEQLQQRPAPAAADFERRSLLATVDAGAREAGLGGALLRVEPVSASQVRVYFQQAGFDALMDWLQALSASHGVRIAELSVQKSAGVGLVDARLTLDAPAP